MMKKIGTMRRERNRILRKMILWFVMNLRLGLGKGNHNRKQPMPVPKPQSSRTKSKRSHSPSKRQSTKPKFLLKAWYPKEC